METSEEETLALTHKQAKTYPSPEEEKRRLQQAQVELEKEVEVEKRHAKETKDTTGTSRRNRAEQNIIKKIMQTEVPMKLNDLILTMPQLHTALLNMTPVVKTTDEPGKDTRSGSGENGTSHVTHIDYRKTPCSGRDGYPRDHPS